MAYKSSTVGHVANQVSRLYCESGVTTSTLSKTEGEMKKKERGVIYQCKVNNFHLNLTKNQYFITKLLARMKKNGHGRSVLQGRSIWSSM